VRQIENDLMPANKGHLVKSLGDGLLLEFDDARTAVLAAIAIQQASAQDNQGQPPEKLMLLRVGIEESDVIVNEHDVFGHGVNLAARFAALAGPGDIVVSAAVREQITPDLDADVEDLGECFLKHVKDPVRAYRIRPPGLAAPPRLPAVPVNLFPTLAVIPFTGRDFGKEHNILGDILAEELIRNFSRSPDLNVISRLSTTAFSHRLVSLDEVRDHLNANYVLSGTYRVDGDRIHLDAELAESKSSGIVWSERMEGKTDSIIIGDSEIIGRLTRNARLAIVSREIKRSTLQSLPTLESYSLLMGAVALMHRMSLKDFQHAHDLLEALIDRASQQSVPRAWLAQWHVLRWQQGWTDDPDRDAAQALDCSKRALDADPESSLALSIDGLVRTHFTKELDIAAESYRKAVEANPNDPLARLHKGALHAFTDQGELAVEETDRALSLSPLDLHRYYYDSLAATACLSANNFEDALLLAEKSLRANKAHTSTLRVKAVTQWQLGLYDDARRTAEELLILEPTLTVSKWSQRSPGATSKMGKHFANVLRKLGIPK
ncbi:MAG: adenylate/guanylate cyclase domain-containing protein, partial [Pseudomonadota bacterium]